MIIRKIFRLVGLGVMGFAISGFADTIYVWTNSAADGPGTAWTNAYHVLQDAVDTAADGDTVLVTNGVYDAGGMMTPGYALTNRIAVTNRVTVRSVKGPQYTFIVGAGPNGSAAVRCAYLVTNSCLFGFTLTNGHTAVSGHNFWDKSGGGAFLDQGGTLSNCVIVGNDAEYGGGGVFCWRENGVLKACTISGNISGTGAGLYCREGGTADRCMILENVSSGNGGGVYCTYTGQLNNCLISGNTAEWIAGGAYDIQLRNCTVCGNTAGKYAGGIYNLSRAVCNSIIYHNTARRSANYYNSTGTNWSYAYCCVEPALPGVGNITNAPGLVGLHNPHIVSNSPCIDAGDNGWAEGSMDIDGDPRINGTVDIGCDEYTAGVITGALNSIIRAEYTNAVVGFPLEFISDIHGKAFSFIFDMDDSVRFTNETVISYAWPVTGHYEVVLSVYNADESAGVTATVSVHIVHFTNYVSMSGAGVAPYGNWHDAATNIQDAIDACSFCGGVVLVTDGLYAAHACMAGGHSNRIVVDRPIHVCSVNGPQQTSIQGAGPLGNSAVRCAYLAGGAELSGFTLTNGYTRTAGELERYGGGVFIERNGALHDCVICENTAYWHGGGIYCHEGGVVSGCTVNANSTYAYRGGGVYCYDGGRVEQCTINENQSHDYGGGVYCDGHALVKGCAISGNTASEGGGVSCGNGDVVAHCTITNNQSTGYGGGVACWAFGTVSNCVIRGNTAPYRGAGIYCQQNGVLNNCLVHANSNAALGGGIYFVRGGYANNCTISENMATNQGGGIYADQGGALRNCVIWKNQAGASGHNWYTNNSGAVFEYCCTAPTNGIPGGTGCITNDPLFMESAQNNFQLRYGSPVIDHGTNIMSVMDDIDGHSRPLDGNYDGSNAWDMGCSEYDPATADSNTDSVPDWWYHGYGLNPTGVTVASDDDDQDRCANREEWIADTNPMDSNSFFHITVFSNRSAIAVYYSSSTNCLYTLEGRSGLVSGVWTNVFGAGPRIGLGGEEVMRDTNQPSCGPYYRLSAKRL